MEVTVQDVTLDDLEYLPNIYDNDGEEHTRSLSTYPLADWVMRSDTLFLKAQVRKPVGFIVVRLMENEAKIDMLSVLKSYKGKGIKRKLLDEVEETLPGFDLRVYVPKKNRNLMNFYKRAGFLVVGEVSNLFGKGNHGALLTKKVVQPILTEKRPKPKGFRLVKEKTIKTGRRSILDENLAKLDEIF